MAGLAPLRSERSILSHSSFSLSENKPVALTRPCPQPPRLRTPFSPPQRPSEAGAIAVLIVQMRMDPGRVRSRDLHPSTWVPVSVPLPTALEDVFEQQGNVSPLTIIEKCTQARQTTCLRSACLHRQHAQVSQAD